MGSPEYTIDILEALKKQGKDEIIAIITHPDRPAGRGQKIILAPLKEYGLKEKIKVFQPENIKSKEFIEEIKKLKPDLIIVCSYGKILPKEIFDLPVFYSINVHFSLLPKNRGPAPIQWAIIRGEKFSGVSITLIKEKVDAGEIILQKKVKISPNDDYFSLQKKLVKTAIPLLLKALDLIRNNQVVFSPQNEEKATFAPSLKKEDGLINWNLPATEIYNRLRAFSGWPGVYFISQKRRVKILKAKPIELKEEIGLPGTIVEIIPPAVVVKCGKGYLLLEEVQPESKKIIKAIEYICGLRLKKGDILI